MIKKQLMLFTGDISVENQGGTELLNLPRNLEVARVFVKCMCVLKDKSLRVN